MVRLRKNDRVILKEKVNCIPAGCYKFLERNEDLLCFQVGKKIVFGFSIKLADLVEKTRITARLTTPEDFIVQYYSLLGDGPSSRGEAPYSFCNMDPSFPLVQELQAAYLSGRRPAVH